MAIPVIDIFAGPGGLGEGFSALIDENMKRSFQIVLSVEKDFFAHQTLTLRSFFRQFDPGQAPGDYYEFLKGKIKVDELFNRWPQQAEKARNEALFGILGDNGDAIPIKKLDNIIQTALNGKDNWVLIGGPPCQAYSIVGRSRRKELVLNEKKDERVGLYKQYLRILAVHNPAVFVMENVKGLLSARTKNSNILSRILRDLSAPADVYKEEYHSNSEKAVCPGYKIFSITARARFSKKANKPINNKKDFIVESERYGIPQTRHRLIMLGIRNDIEIIPEILKTVEQVQLSDVISGLPRLRGGLSKIKDTKTTWRTVVQSINKGKKLSVVDSDVRNEIQKQIGKIKEPHKGIGAEYIPYKKISCKYQPDWFLDPKIEGVCNHISRTHKESDLLRYFFASCYTRVKKHSPKLINFPEFLLPEHKNVNEGIANNKFGDRFRVQVWNQPSKTVTSHISKDGHYYIHPDPTQCRSFTVREAARIQTFPDNYYFCGPRTEQFIQVGNAVPPLLAKEIANIVKNIIITFNQDEI